MCSPSITLVLLSLKRTIEERPRSLTVSCVEYKHPCCHRTGEEPYRRYGSSFTDCSAIFLNVRGIPGAPNPVYYLTESDVLGMYAGRFGISEEEAHCRQLRPGNLSSALSRPELAAHYENVDFAR